MSGYITASGENYLLRLISNSDVPLTNYYVALVRTKPVARFASGTELDEPVTTDYQRAVVPNNAGQWTERNRFISNTSEIDFPNSSAEWGQIQYWAICSAPVGGQVLWAGDLPTPIYVNPAQRSTWRRAP